MTSHHRAHFSLRENRSSAHRPLTHRGPRLAVAAMLGVVLPWGAGAAPAPATTSASSWTTIPASPGRTWTSVSTENRHTCAIDSAQQLWCWGDNAYGQLGDGTQTDSSTPVLVATDVWTWKAVDVGSRHTCGIGFNGWDPDGWNCWGDGSDGQMGDGSGTPPVRLGAGQPWLSVATGGTTSCSYRGDNTLFCYGNHEPVPDGTWLGVSPGARFLCAISGDDGGLWCWYRDADEKAHSWRISRATGWSSVSTGDRAVCAIRSSGSLWCWSDGTLRAVGGGRSWKSVSTGATRACAIDTTDRLWCWGAGVKGTILRGTPVPMAAGATWSTVSVGNTGIYAISPDGVLRHHS